MDTLESNRLKMVDLLLRMAPEEGMRETSLSGVKTMRMNQSTQRVPVLYEPSIVFVAQGQKHGYLGDNTFVYDALNFLVLTVPLPLSARPPSARTAHSLASAST